MSAIVWAKTVGCDYPGCENTAEATMPDNSLSQAPPSGWIDLGQAMIQLQAPLGNLLRQFCPVHASFSIRQLMEILQAERKEKTGGDGG